MASTVPEAVADAAHGIASDETFGIDRHTLEALSRPEDFTGLSRRQVERFLRDEIDPLLDTERESIRQDVSEVRV